jgi:tRNA pseudouridine38-40 synthase
VASGRTDAGVHASGQVVHFVLKRPKWTSEVLRRALNSRLPPSIRVLKVQPVSLDFHAQRSAIKKQYSYYFQQGAASHAPVEALSWWIHKRLDQEAMKESLKELLGVHDFLPFQARGAKVKSTVREILEAEVDWIPLPVGYPGGWVLPGHSGDFGFVRVRLVGTGFLKQMVRGIAGTLLEIGENRRPRTALRDILNSKDRSLVGPTAPARALWLEQVWYDEFS